MERVLVLVLNLKPDLNFNLKPNLICFFFFLHVQIERWREKLAGRPTRWCPWATRQQTRVKQGGERQGDGGGLASSSMIDAQVQRMLSRRGSGRVARVAVAIRRREGKEREKEEIF